MIKPLASALALAITFAVAGPAAANTIWAFPYKAPPYSVPHDHAKRANKPAQVGDNATRASRQSGSAMIIAHHKPPYHDGVPKPPRSEEPDIGPRATS